MPELRECLVPKSNPKSGWLSVKLAGLYVNIHEVSRRLNIDQGQLSKIFSGRSKLTADRASELANCFGMELEEFLYAFKRRSRSRR